MTHGDKVQLPTSYQQERQRQPEGDKRVAAAPRQPQEGAQRLYGPPAFILLCWMLFPCTAVVQSRHPQLDFLLFVTAFSFAALVLGFFVLPFFVLGSAVKWCIAPDDQKDIAACSLIGWGSAWVFLLLGFQIVPWSGAF